MPRCYYGGGSDDHAWIVHQEEGMNTHVGCADCPATLDLEDLVESYTTHQRLVATGIAVITGELEQYREDLKKAAGELSIPFEEMPAGSFTRQLVMANSLLRQERDRARFEVNCHRQALKDLLDMAEQGCSSEQLAARVDMELNARR